MNLALLKQALIGTDKPIAANPLAEDVGRIEAVESLGEAISSDSAAWLFLLKAGCYALAERAGLEAEINENPHQDSSPIDAGRPIPSKIVEILFEFLKEFQDQPQTPLHFLRKLTGKNLFFPTETLPRFLDVFSQRRMFKDDINGTIISLLGERGRWLAGKNPDWRWASGGSVDAISSDPAEVEEIWNEGTFSERKAALKILSDHSPATAKRLLVETWKNDKAEHREAFLNLLFGYFDDSDVEFLETSLSDRSKNIRKIAAVCLARLPNSDFARRARTRAEQILVPANTGKKLQIAPPKEFTKEMKADGFEEKPPRGVGEKAWWTAEILKLVPLVHWEKHFEKTPAQLLAALTKDDYFSSALEAWTYVVQHFDDHDHWLEPLWDAWNTIDEKSVSEHFQLRDVLIKFALGRDPVRFWKKLRSEKRGAQRFVFDLDSAWAGMMQDMPEPWDNEFTVAVLDYMETSRDSYDSLKTLLPFFPAATRPHIRRIMQRLEDSQKQPGYYTNHIDKCREILRQCEEFEEQLKSV